MIPRLTPNFWVRAYYIATLGAVGIGSVLLVIGMATGVVQ